MPFRFASRRAGCLVAGVVVAAGAMAPARAETIDSDAPAVSPADARVDAQWQWRVYGLSLNGIDLGAQAVLMHGAALALPLSALRVAEVDTTPLRSVEIRGIPMVTLDQLTPVRVDRDEPQQQLNIEIPPQWFPVRRVQTAARRPSAAPDPDVRGGFVNYDVLGSGSDTHSASVGAALDAGVFGRWGLLTSAWSGTALTETTRRIDRLDTRWQFDWPASMRTLIVGDTVGSGGSWGMPLRLGGIRYGTNFSTRPDYIYYPQPQFSGSAALPSTLDVYIDGVRHTHQPLPPGPFDLTVPTGVTGGGEARVVIRDLLGRETEFVGQYFSSYRLLGAGVSDFSVEAGWQRLGYAGAGDYGDALAVAQQRYGLSDRVTLEWRGEASEDITTFGAGLSAGLPLSLLGTVAGAGSQDGWSALVSLQSLNARGLVAGLQAQWRSADFRQLGDGERPGDRFRGGAQASWVFAHGWRLGTSWVERRNVERGDVRILSVSASGRIVRGLYLGLSQTALRGDEQDDYALLSLSAAFGLGTTASANYSTAGAQPEQQYAINYREPAYNGNSVQLSFADGIAQRRGARVDWRAQAAELSLQGAQVAYADDTTSAWRANLRGGFGMAGGVWGASRTLGEGFAVVDAGAPGVGVRVNHARVGVTDRDGRLLVRQVLPYQHNEVTLDTRDLPLDWSVQASSMTAVPAYRGGVALQFDAHPSRAVRLRIRLPDGSVPPAGSRARGADDVEVPVGFDGQLYVADIQRAQDLRLSWAGGDCRVALTPAPPSDATQWTEVACEPL